MRLNFQPVRRPRHPLMRALSVVVGLAVVGVLMVFGLVVLSVLLVGGGLLLAWRQWKLSRHPQPVTRAAHSPDVLEGEFVVIERGQHAAR
jgi:hypothetical protein